MSWRKKARIQKMPEASVPNPVTTRSPSKGTFRNPTQPRRAVALTPLSRPNDQEEEVISCVS